MKIVMYILIFLFLFGNSAISQGINKKSNKKEKDQDNLELSLNYATNSCKPLLVLTYDTAKENKAQVRSNFKEFSKNSDTISMIKNDFIFVEVDLRQNKISSKAKELLPTVGSRVYLLAPNGRILSSSKVNADDKYGFRVIFAMRHRWLTFKEVNPQMNLGIYNIRKDIDKDFPAVEEE